MGGKFKFQVQDSDLEYFFLEIWRFEKHIAFSEKKKHLYLSLAKKREVRSTCEAHNPMTCVRDRQYIE